MYQLLPHLKSDVRIIPAGGEIHVLTGDNGIGKTSCLNYHAENFLSENSFVFSEQKPLQIFFDRTLSSFRRILIEDSENCDREFFSDFWKKSGLAMKEDRLLSELSGGESQLLKLISQCSSKKEFYLIDEPGQYLDRDKKKMVSELLQVLTTRKAGVIVIDHDLTWFPQGTIIHEFHQLDGVFKERKQWTI